MRVIAKIDTFYEQICVHSTSPTRSLIDPIKNALIYLFVSLALHTYIYIIPRANLKYANEILVGRSCQQLWREGLVIAVFRHEL